jgi:hypothetical protein
VSPLRALHREESGQALILMILAMTLVFLAGVIVVDFGFWFSGRASLVNATDQASLSGSLYLPTDGAGAEAAAIAYLQENDPDVDLSEIEVTFRCIVGDRNNNGLPDTGDIPAICPQLTSSDFTCINRLCYAVCDFSAANSKCNTIVVKGSRDVPFGFADTFGLADGKSAGFTSATCRGSCGQSPTVPLDVVMVIDRSGSMSCNPSGGICNPNSDLGRAQAGARAVLEIFDPEVQRVSLAVLGPSSTSATCSGANSPGRGISTSSGGTWLPVGFSTDYNNGSGTLNSSSLLVKTINCLNTSSVGTNLGDPMQAAHDLLVNSGRPGVTKGIIFLTDGAANEPGAPGTPGYTFFRPCTAEAPVTSGAGDNNGYENNRAGLCADGGTAGQDSNSGTGGNTVCATAISSGNRDRHRFSGFGLGHPVVPNGTTVRGIEVRLDAWVGATGSSARLCARLSWDGGTSWTAPIQTSSNLTLAEQTYVLGGGANTWGRTWTPAELANGNFVVEVTNTASNTTTTFALDTVQVAVTYFTPDPNYDGPCDYAAEKADAARASGIEIYTIGYGVDQPGNNQCVDEGVSSPFEDSLTTALLAYMAHGDIRYDDGGDGEPGGNPLGCTTTAGRDGENSDDDHFLCEARGNELVPLFKAAAEALAGGSRLIRIPPGL